MKDLAELAVTILSVVGAIVAVHVLAYSLIRWLVHLIFLASDRVIVHADHHGRRTFRHRPA
jgi:hypothetical protein